MYFVSEVLTDTKSLYPQTQKLLYADIMATKKLQHNFTEHEVSVVTSFLLGEVVRNRDAIKFVSRAAIKSLALADFITEWTEVQAPTPKISHEYWTLYFDGSVMGLVRGARVVLVSPEGNRLRYSICIHFPASNNASEYEGLINSLYIAIELGASRLYVRGDSELVVDQVMKESSCRHPLMVAYC